jgi:hypothetical protein
MSYKILRPTGERVFRSTVRKLTPQEWEDKNHANLRDAFDLAITKKYGDPMSEAGVLKDENKIKNRLSIETASAASTPVLPRIEDQPAFAWWAGQTLRRRNRIIASLQNRRYHKCTQKFGIELPKRDALALEMKNVRVAFDVLKDSDNIPVGYQQIKCHVVFGIKMGSLKRKCRLFPGGHVTEARQRLHMPVLYLGNLFELHKHLLP